MSVIDPNEIKEFIRTKEHLVPYEVEFEEDTDIILFQTSKTLITERIADRWNLLCSRLNLGNFERFPDSSIESSAVTFEIYVSYKGLVIIDRNFNDNDSYNIENNEEEVINVIDEIEDLFNIFTVFDIPWK